MASRLGLTGPSGSRRRGALLRRLLADRRLGGDLRGALRCHRGDLDHRRRQALLGGALHPGLDLGAQAARALRQRPSAHPPQHPRRAALAGLGQRPGHDRPRRPARAQPGRPALGEERDHGRDRRSARLLRGSRGAALRLAPPDRRRHRPRDRAGADGRRGGAPHRHPSRGPAAPGRLPLGAARQGPPCVVAAARLDRGDLTRGSRPRCRAGGRRRAGDERGRRRAPDRGVQARLASVSLSCPSTTACSVPASSSTGSPSCRCSTSASPTRRARPWR